MLGIFDLDISLIQSRYKEKFMKKSQEKVSGIPVNDQLSRCLINSYLVKNEKPLTKETH